MTHEPHEPHSEPHSEPQPRNSDVNPVKHYDKKRLQCFYGTFTRVPIRIMFL